MRVLITGGAGFIGSHTVERLLAAGHELLVLDDLSTGHRANLDTAAEIGLPAEALVVADISTEEAQLAAERFGADVMVLLAAQMSVTVSMRDPLLDARVNVLGQLRMLQAAVRSGCRRVVFASSGGTIYGPVPAERLPIAEGSARVPASFYGLTKSVLLDYLRLHQEQYGLEWVALAFGNVYGPRQDPHGEAGVVAIFADRLRRGMPCVVNGDGHTTRDYVHVLDVVAAVEAATRRGSGLINIGTGIETSVLEVYRGLAAGFGLEAEPQFGPALPGEVRRVCLDVGRAAAELDWRAGISFADGVAGMVERSFA